MRFISFFSVLILIVLVNSCQSESFTIKGELHQVPDTKAYLIHENPINNTIDVLDSSDVKNGYFSFKGCVEYPIACVIKIGRKTKVNLIVDNSIISITGSALIPEEIKVIGSKSDDDYHKLLKKSHEIASLKNKVWAEYVGKNSNPHISEQLNNQYFSMEDSLLDATKRFVEKKPTSVGAAYFVYYLYLDRQIDISKLTDIINSFDESISGSEYIKYLKDEIVLYTPLPEGSPAPDFNCKSIKSDSVFHLSEFKGKYLYLHFSASWVKNWDFRAKRMANLYESSKDCLNILTVYLDTNKDCLLKKVSDSTIRWKQSCNYEYWEDPITKHYRVCKIPYGVLIDPQGNVIALNPDLSNIESIIKQK